MLIAFSSASIAGASFLQENLSVNDAVYVVDHAGKEIFNWQADKPLVPASLTKLATAYLALEKWGGEHHFTTDFYLAGDTLWVKGYGDPFLISEELELIAQRLSMLGLSTVRELKIDNTFFSITKVPGRSQVSDPYNAPMSAVAANFNTAMLRQHEGRLVSAEPQTPLTKTAQRVAQGIGVRATRVNLRNAINAQQNFAELLVAKCGWKDVRISVGQQVPTDVPRLFSYQNSRSLAEVLRGALEYSNNFIANQVFLKLAEQSQGNSVTFEAASAYARAVLEADFSWQGAVLQDGAGLTRDNRLSAYQLDDLLKALTPNKRLLKEYLIDRDDVNVFAKTGTLNAVHSFAGYIEFPAHSFRFVFNFNRTVPYQYRIRLLDKLVMDLKQQIAATSGDLQ
ncbi:D-alanyl-D-alanine carboxypeptidase [Arenicella xantha]|nr:D-alanyl-D-alanine carboxypeptidase [Arenicella xantha]